MDQYNVVVTGHPLAGFATKDILLQLAELFNLPADRVATLVRGKRVIVRRRVDRATAEEYVQRLTAIGLECAIERPTLEIDAEALRPSTTDPESHAKPIASNDSAVPITGVADEFWNAIAQKRGDYYVPRWKRYASGENPFPSWHWPALFASWLWAAYRKLWAASAAFLLISLIAPLVAAVVLPLQQDGALSAGAAIIIFLMAVAVAWILPPMLANRLYYRRARRLVEEAEHNPEPQSRITFLNDKGGTSAAGVTNASAGVIVLAVALSLLSRSAYEDYTIRARVAEAVIATEECRREVADFYETEEDPPGSILLGKVEWSCLAHATTPYIQRIYVAPAGEITVTMADVATLGEAAGKTLSLGAADANGVLLTPLRAPIQVAAFKCAPGTIPVRYTPKFCR
jgi:type IV pilus assembly protein PilA